MSLLSKIYFHYALSQANATSTLNNLSKEADAFTRAIRLDEIPKEYKGMRLIGRGNTSIILEKDAETVIMLTRDAMKKDWLHMGLRISKDWKIQDVKAKDRKFEDFNVYAIEMPKLFKLSPQNRKKVNDELKFFEKSIHSLNMGYFKAKNNLPKILDFYDKQGKTSSILYRLMEFLLDYNAEQWNWDLAKRQFAEDKQGNIVLIDPIAEAKLTQMMHLEKKRSEIDDVEYRLLYKRK